MYRLRLNRLNKELAKRKKGVEDEMLSWLLLDLEVARKRETCHYLLLCPMLLPSQSQNTNFLKTSRF